MNTAKKAFRLLCFAVALYSLCFAVAPLPFGVRNAGMVGLGLYGAALLLLLSTWNLFDGWGRIPRRLHEVSDRRRAPAPYWWKRARFLAALILALYTAGSVCASALMAKAAWGNPPAPGATVIVLGCQVQDGKPSLMLARRLDAALLFLQENPESVVVCSGGGPEGALSEAAVMSQYLQEHGISPERIYLEERSSNTKENVAFSAGIIRENGLSEQAAIASDGFHQLRGQLYARKNGLAAGGLPAVTPWGLLPSYWVREWFGVAKAVVLD